MEPEQIRALVFDMGGVLYDTPRETILMTRFILDHLDSELSSSITDLQIAKVIDQVDALFDRGLVDMNVDPHWLPTFEDSVAYDKLILKALGIKDDLDSIASDVHRKWIEATPRMKPKFIEPCRDVLKALRFEGYKMGIASNRRNDPVLRLKSDGVLHFFDVIEYSCVPGYRKPSPYMLLQTAIKLDINPNKCAYIGDKMDPDMMAAKRADFVPIMLVWCSPEEADKAPSDVNVIYNIEELWDFFSGTVPEDV
jgi:HAD superfamily hydrolase (TIGR01549 family)